MESALGFRTPWSGGFTTENGAFQSWQQCLPRGIGPGWWSQFHTNKTSQEF